MKRSLPPRPSSERCQQLQAALLEPPVPNRTPRHGKGLRVALAAVPRYHLVTVVWGVPSVVSCKKPCEGRTDSAS